MAAPFRSGPCRPKTTAIGIERFPSHRRRWSWPGLLGDGFFADWASPLGRLPRTMRTVCRCSRGSIGSPRKAHASSVSGHIICMRSAAVPGTTSSSGGRAPPRNIRETRRAGEVFGAICDGSTYRYAQSLARKATRIYFFLRPWSSSHFTSTKSCARPAARLFCIRCRCESTVTR